LNALLLRKELARVAKLDHIRDAVLIKLMILEYVHPDLFAQLFGWQSQQKVILSSLPNWRRLSQAKGDANEEESAKKIDGKWAMTAVRKWVAMQPLLRDVDLRDYFWVARDRLESTFSGIAMCRRSCVRARRARVRLNPEAECGNEDRAQLDCGRAGNSVDHVGSTPRPSAETRRIQRA